MKKLTLLLLLCTFFVNSQERITIGLFQDAKLLVSDDNHGNIAPTTDITVYVSLEGQQFENYYFSMQPFYEQADLLGGHFKRYGVNSVWNLNNLVLNKLEIGLGTGIGLINRPGISVASYQFVGEISYPITKWLKLASRYEYVRRSDLDSPEFRHNVSAGIKILLYKI